MNNLVNELGPPDGSPNGTFANQPHRGPLAAG